MNEEPLTNEELTAAVYRLTQRVEVLEEIAVQHFHVGNSIIKIPWELQEAARRARKDSPLPSRLVT